MSKGDFDIRAFEHAVNDNTIFLEQFNGNGAGRSSYRDGQGGIHIIENACGASDDRMGFIIIAREGEINNRWRAGRGSRQRAAFIIVIRILIIKKGSPLFRDLIRIDEKLFMERFDEPGISAEEVEFILLLFRQITFLHFKL